MKTKLFIAAVFFTSCYKVQGQYAVHDALEIRKYYDEAIEKLSADDSAIKKYTVLLKSYLPAKYRNSLTINDDAITTLFTLQDKENPFLKDLIPNTSSSSVIPGPAGIISNILDADVTQFADGLAKFLVKRTKEELSVAFFNQFKEDMNSEKYSDLRILFPQTAKLLNLIDSKIYQFSAYLTELRESFILDLNSLPSSALVVINLPKYNEYFKAHPVLKKAFHAGLFLSNLIIQKDSVKHIGNVIGNMPVDQYFSLNNKTEYDTVINGAMKTLKLFSTSLRSADTTGAATQSQRYWVTADSLFMMLNDPITFKIYLGLIYQEALEEKILFPGNDSLVGILKQVAAHIEKTEQLKNSLTDFFASLNVYDDYKKQWSNIKKGLQKDSLGLYSYGIFSSSITVLEAGMQLPVNISGKATNLINDKIIPVFKSSADIYMYVTQKKYGPAVLSLVDLYKTVFKEAADSLKKKFNLVKLSAHLSTYGSFISQVAKAENSDEVASIIEKTVLPTGSSYIKKNSKFNIALQAYTGIYGGQQRQVTDSTTTSAMGVYAPLGIGFSWGSKEAKKSGLKKKSSSFTVFVSVIDVGSLVSYRFTNTNDSLANDINIRLNQILAPGLHFVYGFPKVPLSFGIGANWTPLLTKVESNAISVLNIDSRPFRWQAFLAVDIPFFNFYNKPR
jgi:hypothetical protein